MSRNTIKSAKKRTTKRINTVDGDAAPRFAPRNDPLQMHNRQARLHLHDIRAGCLSLSCRRARFSHKRPNCIGDVNADDKGAGLCEPEEDPFVYRRCSSTSSAQLAKA